MHVLRDAKRKEKRRKWITRDKAKRTARRKKKNIGRLQNTKKTNNQEYALGHAISARRRKVAGGLLRFHYDY